MAYDAIMISDLSDIELDAVAAGCGCGCSRTTNTNTNNTRNVTVAQAAANNQINAALLSSNASQGGNQSNQQAVVVG